MKKAALLLTIFTAINSCTLPEEDIVINLPSVTTSLPTDISPTGAVLNGEVTADGGAAVTERGFIWSRTSPAQSTGTKLPAGMGTGSHSAPLSGLSNNTTYYVQAYAVNEKGIGVGTEISFSTTGSSGNGGSNNGNNGNNTFTDTRDGKTYSTVTIAGKTWMAQNLNYDAGAGSYCYDLSDANCESLGRLYTYSAAVAAVPTGWRLPTKSECEQLITAMGGPSAAYTALQAGGSSGFNAKLAGFRNIDNTFVSKGAFTDFWTSTPEQIDWTYVMDLNTTDKKAALGADRNARAFSLRCVKIENTPASPTLAYTLTVDGKNNCLLLENSVATHMLTVAGNYDVQFSGDAFFGPGASHHSILLRYSGSADDKLDIAPIHGPKSLSLRNGDLYAFFADWQDVSDNSGDVTMTIGSTQLHVRGKENCFYLNTSVAARTNIPAGTYLVKVTGNAFFSPGASHGAVLVRYAGTDDDQLGRLAIGSETTLSLRASDQGFYAFFADWAVADNSGSIKIEFYK